MSSHAASFVQKTGTQESILRRPKAVANIVVSDSLYNLYNRYLEWKGSPTGPNGFRCEVKPRTSKVSGFSELGMSICPSEEPHRPKDNHPM